MISNLKSFWKQYLLIAIVFCAVVSINFAKPFGFFRESNPALVAITASYWNKNPDIRKQHIPLYSYSFQKDQPPSTQFDNTITTFGYAWFAVPYYFLKLTYNEPGPIGLRIFSLCWLLFTAIAIYKLVSLLGLGKSNSRFINFLTIAFYLLSPVVMWYQVNGYVHETAVLPLYYLSWYFFLRFIKEEKTKWLWWTAFFILLGIQFDWLPFFQGVVMSIYLLFNKKRSFSKWVFLLPGTAVLLGVAYIFYHYTSWSSVTDYVQFMKWKFGSRTVGEQGPSYISFLPPSFNIAFFYVLSYGVLLIFSMIALFRKKLPTIVWLMIITAILHHIVFWGFSSEHDYAALKMSFPLAFAASLLISDLKKRYYSFATIAIIVFAIGQYYLLHNVSYRKGMHADDDFLYKAGTAVKHYAADELIYVETNGIHFPQVEFYAGRPYIAVESFEEAKEKFRNLHANRSARFIRIPIYDNQHTNVLWESYDLNAQVSDTTKVQ